MGKMDLLMLMPTIDWSSVPTLVVAVGTIALAAVTYQSVSINKKQVLALLKQVTVTKSQFQPVLSVMSSRFVGNRLQLEVMNAGNGMATHLALSVFFSPVGGNIVGDSNDPRPLSREELLEAIKEGKPLYADFPIEFPKLRYQGKEVGPYEIALFLVDPNSPNLELSPGQICSYNVELQFLVRYKKEWSEKPLKYPELREFLRSNGVAFIGVRFAVEGKDMADNPIQARGLGGFVINLLTAESVEEGSKSGLVFNRYALLPDEVMKRIGWMDHELYSQMRTYANAIDEEKT